MKGNSKKKMRLRLPLKRKKLKKKKENFRGLRMNLQRKKMLNLKRYRD